jgi:hypothetical protein
MVVVEEDHALAVAVADHHVAEDGGAIGAGAKDDVVAPGVRYSLARVSAWLTSSGEK